MFGEARRMRGECKETVMRKPILRWSWALVFFMVPFSGRSADDLRTRADAAWAARETPAQTLLAIQLYEQLAAKNPADKAVRIRLAQAASWAFEQDPKMGNDKVVQIMDKGIKACKEILAQNEDDPEANYWLMWDMAGRTLARGVFSGFAFKEALVATIMVAKSDIGYQYGGVYCYWAIVINTLPNLLGRFFHFSNDDAVWLYQRAVALEPRYLRSRFFLGVSYEVAGKKAEARKEYQFCISQPDDALPEAIPENKLYRELAKETILKL